MTAILTQCNTALSSSLLALVFESNRSTSMGSLLHLLSSPHSLLVNTTITDPIFSNPSHFSPQTTSKKHFSFKCTASDSNPDSEFPPLELQHNTLNPPEYFPIEKRRRSEITRDRRAKEALVKPEPPNFQIGWKRTKEIKLEKPVGWVVMDFLDKLEALMEREFGSTKLLAKVGEIVAERAREEAEILRDEGKVEERMVTELSRVLRLMEMDLAMVKAAVKEETFIERLEQAKARCRQAILVAKSF